jgi:hypothetical protein
MRNDFIPPAVMPHENKKDSSAVLLSFGWILKNEKMSK